jgi:hypothetical protein
VYALTGSELLHETLESATGTGWHDHVRPHNGLPAVAKLYRGAHLMSPFGSSATPNP